MSFRCDVCKETSPTGVAPHTVVTRIRKRVYHANQSFILGHEIVCEVNACTSCKSELGEPIVNEGDVPSSMNTHLPEHSKGELPPFQGNTIGDLVLRSWGNVA